MSGISGIGGRASGIQDIMALRQQIMERSQLLQQVKTPDAAGAAAPTSGIAGGSFTDTLKGELESVNATQQKSSAITEKCLLSSGICFRKKRELAVNP